MKMTCSRTALASALQTVAAIVPTKTPKSVLQSAKVEANDGQVVLLATDADSSIRYRVAGATIDEPGAFEVSAAPHVLAQL